MRDAIQQFGDAMRAAGIDPPEKIEADGNLHRFSTNGKRKDDAGWYVLYADGIPAGHFGDLRSGLSQPWSANIGHDLSKTELAAHRELVIAIQIEKQADDELRRGEAAKKAAAIWDASEPASADHPYLVRKGVGAHGLRVSREALVVPVRDISSKLMSLQFIDMDGNKRFMKDGKIEAGLFGRSTRTFGSSCAQTTIVRPREIRDSPRPLLRRGPSMVILPFLISVMNNPRLRPISTTSIDYMASKPSGLRLVKHNRPTAWKAQPQRGPDGTAKTRSRICSLPLTATI